MIKPIETVYKGYRFRSRLEARWAVFFDALELAWEYEKEGFELSDGTKYLPDFYLSNWNLWIEIKPEYPDKKIFNKCEKFRDEIGAIALFWGLPGQTYGKLFLFEVDDGGGGVYETEVGFIIPNNNKKICLDDLGSFRERTYFNDVSMQTPISYLLNFIKVRNLKLRGEWRGGIEPKYAFTAARSARFEYGENGGI